MFQAKGIKDSLFLFEHWLEYGAGRRDFHPYRTRVSNLQFSWHFRKTM